MKKIIIILILLSFSLVSIEAAEFSWKASKASESLLLDISALPSGKLVAVGERGHILLSTDNGENWQQAVVPTQSSLTAVTFVDENNGWAVGHDSIILVTVNGGEEWKVQFVDVAKEQPFFDVSFTSPQNGIAIGAYGLILQTSDAGKSWIEFYPETLDDPDFGLPHFYHIKNLNSGQQLLVGEAGLIALSVVNEAGKHEWKKLAVDYTGSFFTVGELADGVLIAAGLRGNIFRSVDNGESWKKIDSHTISSIFNVELSLDKKIVTLVGAEGVVLVSYDNGQHFKLHRRADRFGMAAVIFTQSNKIITVGEKGVADISEFITESEK